MVDLLSALRRRGADWIGDDMSVLLPSADEKRNMLPESADPARSGVGMKKAGGLFPGYAFPIGLDDRGKTGHHDLGESYRAEQTESTRKRRSASDCAAMRV